MTFRLVNTAINGSFKEQLLAALVDQGLLSEEVGVASFPKDEETAVSQKVRELELEMRKLMIKEKEIDCNLEIRKLEEETKRILR